MTKKDKYKIYIHKFMSQQDKTLDNTQISNKDIKELEKGQDNKLDNTSSSSTSTKKSNKSKKTGSGTNRSDKAPGVQAQKPIDATGNVKQTTLDNIQSALTDPAMKKDFLGNVADLLCQYQRRKLTDEEFQALENMVEDGLVSKVFRVKKTLA